MVEHEENVSAKVGTGGQNRPCDSKMTWLEQVGYVFYQSKPGDNPSDGANEYYEAMLYEGFENQLYNPW